MSDRLIEPALTGISYSFTIDGYYEEAYYRAVSNPTVPQCPSAVMQWQHGTYSLPGNGSLILQPFAVDGRQLTSTPCTYGESVYERYDQPELMKSYQVLTDPYHNVPRLNLYRFDGSPINPMFLLASPPEMLPTQTLNPTVAAAPAATGKSRVKRAAEPEPAAQKAVKPKKGPVIQQPSEPYNADKWWWAGVGSIALGTVMYMMPTSA